MLAPSQDLHPGSSLEVHALVLSVLSLKEADKLVHIFTPQWGIVAAVATQAARSQKRFGAALEPLNHIKAHLRVPRDPSASEAPLWKLEKADLQDSFLHFRKSYELLESAFFILRLVKDLLPENASDVHVFKALGRFLRDSGGQAAETYPTWARFAFWTWFTHHLGFGDLSAGIVANKESGFVELWHRCLATQEAQFGPLFSALKTWQLPALTPVDEAKIYKKWIELSGINWNYFEQWLATKHF